MAQRMIEKSCERFRREISLPDDREIRSTSLEDVKAAVCQIERELAARSNMRNLDRLNFYLDAMHHYSQVVDVLCNPIPLLPYVWAPVKFILLAVRDNVQVLDKLLGAYAQIGASLPSMSMLKESFREDRDMQQLFAFLYEDIMVFHRKAYKLIRNSGWKIFFHSSWGRFEHRFSTLLDNISQTSSLIEKQATALDISQAKEWRQKSLDDAAKREERWHTEQRQQVLRWLNVDDVNQEDKLDWLHSHWCEGTTTWITKNSKLRTWIQRGRGKPVLWLYGKPGSGKSILCSQIITTLKADSSRRVLFFFCDFHTPAFGITSRILRSYLAQVVVMEPELVSYLYDEYITKSKGLQATAQMAKEALRKSLSEYDDIALVVDGVDEVPASEHRPLLKELTDLAAESSTSCKLLVSCQDLPSIPNNLRKGPSLCLADERDNVKRDMNVIVDTGLQNLQEQLGSALEEDLRKDLSTRILDKADGMFLWVRLVLSLLQESCGTRAELISNIKTVPQELEEVYGKILNIIRNRGDQKKVQRIFEWLLFSQDKNRIQKRDVLIGMSLHGGCAQLDRNSLPFPNALDICKPLIEDGPGGTLGLVHSTVGKFLLGSASGPFITQQQAERSLSLACLAHLTHALDFAAGEERVDPVDRATKTGLGIFGLQNYAAKNWTYHLLEHSRLDSGPALEVADLARQMSSKHADLSIPEEMMGLSSVDLNDNRLSRLISLPKVQALVALSLKAQQRLREEQVEDSRALGITWDTTLFSSIHHGFQTTVHSLLEETAAHRLSEKEFLAFKADYASTAYLCGVVDCIRSRIGYNSRAALDDHDQKAHRNGLKCYQPSCSYNDVGFNSIQALKDHMRRIHNLPNDKPKSRVLPKSLQRKDKAS